MIHGFTFKSSDRFMQEAMQVFINTKAAYIVYHSHTITAWPGVTFRVKLKLPLYQEVPIPKGIVSPGVTAFANVSRILEECSGQFTMSQVSIVSSGILIFLNLFYVKFR
jgi:hypothetical protein